MQVEQGTCGSIATRSPGERWVTDGWACRIVPADSWPRIWGPVTIIGPMRPWRQKWMSDLKEDELCQCSWKHLGTLREASSSLNVHFLQRMFRDIEVKRDRTHKFPSSRSSPAPPPPSIPPPSQSFPDSAPLYLTIGRARGMCRLLCFLSLYLSPLHFVFPSFVISRFAFGLGTP